MFIDFLYSLHCNKKTTSCKLIISWYSGLIQELSKIPDSWLQGKLFTNNSKTKMSNRVKKQHYLSRNYLESFSTPTKKKDLLWVRDVTKHWRESRPENEAFERDFQSLIDEEGNKSDALEIA